MLFQSIYILAENNENALWIKSSRQLITYTENAWSRDKLIGINWILKQLLKQSWENFICAQTHKHTHIVCCITFFWLKVIKSYLSTFFFWEYYIICPYDIV